MRHACRWLLTFALTPLIAKPGGAALTLVRDGVPKATIVVAKEALGVPTEPTMQTIWSPQLAANKVAAAALDLQTYVEKISGAKLPIVSDEKDPGGVVILMGRSTLTKELDKKIPSGLTPLRREEGFIVLCKGNRLVLAGNDAGPYHGTEYAVSEFLERLGVRWFMPGEYGEVVPKMATVPFPALEVRQTPDFILRNWWGPKTPENLLLEYRWKIRNRMNPVLHFLMVPADSSARSYLPAAKIKEDSTLCGKKQDGTPDPGMPNLSNPKAVELVAESIKNYFRKNPEATSCGFAPDDGLPRDWTPETVKQNLGFPDVGSRVGVPAELSVTEEWFNFVNQVAREVRKEFPNCLIGTNGYANRNTPPQGVELEKNLYVMFAAIWSDTLHAYDDPQSWMTYRQGQMLKRWAELCPNVYIYNYTYIMLASGGTPVPLRHKLARDFPLMKKWGIIGFSDEGRSVLMESGIHCQYLRARLEWEAGLNVNTLLNDYFEKWYGAAAKPARAFWKALEDAVGDTRMLGHEDRILPYVYTPELLAELKKNAEEAEQRAATDAAKKHAEADRLIYEHLKGYMAMHEAEWAGNFDEAVRQADYMLIQRKKLSELSRFYCQPDDANSTSGFYYWGIAARKAYYQKLADRVSGKTGRLVALLPERSQFRVDPRDEGRFGEWYDLKTSDRDWETILTTRPFFIQGRGYLDETGYPYIGPIWYRLKVNVPNSARGHKVMLYAPTVETEAWVWVNGKFVGYRPYTEAYVRPNEIDMDVSDALRPGESNVIAVRVNTGLSAASMAGGFYSRLFLYSPEK